MANFDAILEEADGVMVARGDLGVEVDLEELPVIQREIVRKCAIAGKPSIVATHLLESMIDSPMPTRAEVTDVANAVTERADSIMLSGETATGRYPDRCVQILDRIARRMELEPGLGFHELRPAPETQREHLARSACRLADSLNADGIVVVTRRGLFGPARLQLSTGEDPHLRVHEYEHEPAQVERPPWGRPDRMRLSSDPMKTIDHALARLREHEEVPENATIVVVSDVRTRSGELVTSIQVRHVA